MSVAANEHAETLEDVLHSTLAAAENEALVVDPTRETIESLVAVATALDDPPRIRLVAGEAALKGATDDFLVASRTADLIERDVLALRSDGGGKNTLVVTENAVNAVVDAGERVAALSTDDPEFVRAGTKTYGDRFDDAEPFRLRTPPLSTVRETLAEEIGDEVRADFDAALDHVEDGPTPDEVAISLLVAAKNDVLLYDVSKWGEDVGVGSKATFSRTKTRLEERGLLDTEKVPIEVGRPRLRLKLGESAPADAETDVSALVDAIPED